MQKETLINKKISFSQRFLGDFRTFYGLTAISLWISLVMIGAARGETELIMLKMADAELALELPQELVRLDVPMPPVKLLAKLRGLSPYPSLNVIEQVGVLELDRAKLERDTLSSYRSVGLTDARIVSSREGECGARRCELVDIDYTLNRVELRGALVLVDCGSSIALFTFTGVRDQAEQLSSLRLRVMSSITVRQGKSGSSDRGLGGGYDWGLITGGVVLILLASGLIWWRAKFNRF